MDASERVRQGMGQYPIPVVILGRLAVSLTYQGKCIGLALALLRDAIRRALAIAEQAGIRALLTNPIDDDAAHFYARFGFMPSPLREEQWLLLLNDARRMIDKP